ncbi:NACHT domain-containing protein [Spirulina sp. CS-785/01]|uniref:NACHT domain-containing protein n=1 Tax=Spirulina sp. CS-785/01 TaxID=3021716 RepID=UPI00232BBF5C|nr:NACHT domain-containing protein [Spirulina sp. CS-785/01]MDB9314607.1 NACHT domain-containing protein [Spirulina sp. CS-785/01]
MVEGIQPLLLKASDEGIEQAKSAWLNSASQIIETQGLPTSLATIHNFLEGEPIDQQEFQKICAALELNWQEVADFPESSNPASPTPAPPPAPPPPPPPAPPPAPPVRAFPAKVITSLRQRSCKKLQTTAARLPLLNGHSLTIEDLAFDVYLVSKISRDIYINFSSYLENLNQREEFERFGLGDRQQRISGIQAVQKYSKLMILGKAGTGKSAFLRHLAMSCCQKKNFGQLIPIFINLPSLKDYETGLQKQIQQVLNLPEMEQVERLLNAGHLFLLLDGLDEGPLQYRKDLQFQIRAFSQRYYKNRFVLAGRTQITDYTLPTFAHVEIADLHTEQMKVFIKNWFKHTGENTNERTDLAKQLITELTVSTNKPLKELASHPFWLDAICGVFDKLRELPKRRFEFYEESLELLLNEQHNTQEFDNSFQTLDLTDKIELLSHIAIQSIESKNLFFNHQQLYRYIASFFKKKLKLKPEELTLATQEILKGITAHHQILVERAQGVYSFFDLVFQDYLIGSFLLKQLQDNILSYPFNQNSKKIRKQRDFFFNAADKMLHIDDFLLQMKRKIDKLVADDKKIQIFLSWVNQKSILVQAPYKVAAVRAFYFGQAVDRIFEPKLARPLDFSHAVDRTLKSALHDRSLACALDGDLDFAFKNNAIRHLAPDFVIDLILECLLVTYAHDLGLFLKFANDKEIEITPELKRALQRFKDQLPDADKDRAKYQKWWQMNSEIWTRNLRLVIVEHRNVGFDWQFNGEQRDVLKQYYIGNKILVDCMYSTPNVSDEVIQEIEETLLLPITEIKNRRQSR